MDLLIGYLRRILRKTTQIFHAAAPHDESIALMLGSLLSKKTTSSAPVLLREVEFKVFSQWGDDGIIQHIINLIDFPSKTFIEFGVEDYRESNTRFLMMNDNWSGLVIDGSEKNIQQVRSSEYFWKHKLNATAAFINRENISALFTEAGFQGEIGILHIDLDGNDYWIWKSITGINPVLVIMEYNSVFGPVRPITVPYDEFFVRTSKHHSNLYFGASLAALDHLAEEKGYSFIGSNSVGNNAYFLRNEYVSHRLPKRAVEEEFVVSLFRESRDTDGNLTYLDGDERLKVISGLPVYNVKTNQIESL